MPVQFMKSEGWDARMAETTGRFDFNSVLIGCLTRKPETWDAERLWKGVSRTFIVMNVVPIATTIATTTWVMRSDNCPLDPQRECKPLSMILDSIGLVTARLARLDLGVCLLLATRGQSGWLFRATGGLLGFTESVPAHRAAGWCCVTQSVLHSIAYLCFYVHETGLHSLLRYCFPTPKAVGVNRLGLVNGLGMFACFAAFGVTALATIWVRRSHYHIFQRTHLPLTVLFVLCCALHDLQVLLFAAPGIADWYLGRQGKGAFRTVPASVKVIPGTSGPWIELQIVESDENVIATLLRRRGTERAVDEHTGQPTRSRISPIRCRIDGQMFWHQRKWASRRASLSQGFSYCFCKSWRLVGGACRTRQSRHVFATRNRH